MSNLRTFAEYSKETVELEWIIDGLLVSSGTSLVVGDPKAGKSQLIRHLIASYLTKNSFLGHKINGNKKVIYLALEENSGELVKYLDGLGIDENEENLLIGDPMWISKENIIELEEDVIEHEPSLCVIDTFVAFTDIADANDYMKVYKAMQEIALIARRHKCHIIVVHHKNKSESNGTKSIMGSQAFLASVDTCLMLSGETDDKVLKIEPRYSAKKEIRFKMTPFEISGWTETRTGRSCKDSLLDELQESGAEGFKLRDFAGFGRAAIQKAKDELLSEGIISCSGGKSGEPLTLHLM